MNASSSRPQEIILYDWQQHRGVSTKKIAEFLGSTFGVTSSVGSGFERTMISAELCIITDIWHRFGRAQAGASTPPDAPTLYDGHEILRMIRDAGPTVPLDGPLTIIITDMLVCTYDDADARYHARPVVAAATSLVSTASMVWGPARSREYYADVLACAGSQECLDGVESRHAPHHLTSDDLRMQQVAEGYAMQAVFYGMTGEAFCDLPDCRLYNAHWQSELFRAQKGAKLCKRHQLMLDGLI